MLAPFGSELQSQNKAPTLSPLRFNTIPQGKKFRHDQQTFSGQED
jgi:hypothetical protein